MIKIGWLTEFKGQGGAWQTESRMVKKSPKDLDVKVVDTNKFKDRYDYYVLNNFRTFYSLQLEFLIEKKNYFIYWHDVIDTGKDEFVRKLYNNARGNIFLSPLHKVEFCTKFNIDIDKENNCIAPYFAADKYTNNNDNRKDKVCWVGSIQHHKGIDDVLLWSRDNNQIIDFYGKGNSQLINQLQESKYCKYIGFAKMPINIYPKYEYFIHMPDKIEAFGRSCMEAWLSGCKIIKNNKIGMYSYPEIQSALKEKDLKFMSTWLELQPKRFWNYIKDRA